VWLGREAKAVSDLPKMDTSVNAVTVGSTFGQGGFSGGTPGKAASLPLNDRFVSEAIDSGDNTNPWPSLPAYWNVNGNSNDTDKKNQQP
jgi:hypothetical protein